jgi:hypothetical protein
VELVSHIYVMKSIKQYTLVLLMAVIYKYTVEMVSDSMIYVSSFMKTGSGIQAMLRLLPRQSGRLQC